MRAARVPAGSLSADLRAGMLVLCTFTTALASCAACDEADAPVPPALASASQGAPLGERRDAEHGDKAAERSRPKERLQPEPSGVLGGACEVDGDCVDEGAICLVDGFPRGFCSLPCESTCPTELGHAPFCAAAHQLPEGVQWIGEAACLSSCDFGTFPETGCRAGYGCVPLEQGGAATSVEYACLPGVGVALDGAYLELAKRGVSFNLATSPNETPRGMPHATCAVTDPVELRSPLYGIELESVVGGDGSRVLASAEMAIALADAAKGLRELGVKKLLHMGTYNCRPIRGTKTLSRHGHANAIDVYGFEMDDGTRYTVKKHWRKVPRSTGAKLMAAVVEQLVASGRWKVVLTPAYNKDHEDHLHLDLVTDPADPAAFLKRWPKALSSGD